MCNLAADGFRRQGALQRKLALLRADRHPPADATATYLPVRITGATGTFGGTGGHTRYSSVTGVQWLPPTPGSIADTLVIVPPGFQQVSLASV